MSVSKADMNKAASEAEKNVATGNEFNTSFKLFLPFPDCRDVQKISF
jgi:hypothetical protein